MLFCATIFNTSSTKNINTITIDTIAFTKTSIDTVLFTV